MNELQVFEFEMYQTRVIILGGEPWWVAKDVACVLGYTKTEAMLRLLDSDEIAPYKIAGINADSYIINESGIYSAIFGSKKPEAKAFRKWVTSEILPQIRKTGSFLSPADQKLLEQVKSGQLLLVDPKMQQKKIDINLSARKHYLLPDAAAIMDMKEWDFYDALDKIDVLYVERRNGAPWVGLSAKSLELKLGTHIGIKGRLTPVFTRKGMLHIIREMWL
jgi:prophage antirepressor-like protein